MKAKFSRRLRVMLKPWFVTDIDWYVGLWTAAGAEFDRDKFERLKPLFTALIDGKIDADDIDPISREMMTIIVKGDIVWMDGYMNQAVKSSPMVISFLDTLAAVYGIEAAVEELHDILVG